MSIPVNAAKLRRELGLRGLTQKEFAQRVGLTGPSVSRLLATGRANPSTLRRIAAFLVATPVLSHVDLILDEQ